MRLTDLKLLQASPFKEPTFWQGLCPFLTITPESGVFRQEPLIRTTGLDRNRWRLCRQTLQEDGYFVYDDYLKRKDVARLAQGLACLDAARIPPVFCFVYDEYWHVLGALGPILHELLGADYEVLPAVWAWIVKYQEQTAFQPHRDHPEAMDGSGLDPLNYLTIWIPLTDLNHLSSAISVLPASRDSYYGMGTRKLRLQDVQSMRSLQARKGSVLGWTVGLAHWGTWQSRLGTPRMSLGYYVQRSGAPPLVGATVDLEQSFALDDRLALIGSQIATYSRDRDPLLLAFASELQQMGRTVVPALPQGVS